MLKDFLSNFWQAPPERRLARTNTMRRLLRGGGASSREEGWRSGSMRCRCACDSIHDLMNALMSMPRSAWCPTAARSTASQEGH